MIEKHVARREEPRIVISANVARCWNGGVWSGIAHLATRLSFTSTPIDLDHVCSPLSGCVCLTEARCMPAAAGADTGSLGYSDARFAMTGTDS